MKNRLTVPALGFGYLASIWLGVWLVARFGVKPVLGIESLQAPVAVYVVGVSLVLRDLLQDHAGRWPTFALIVLGAALSYWVEPRFALASGVAFLIAETCDMLVYTPMRARLGRIRGVLISNAISIPIDSLIFLGIAFGSLGFFWGQAAGKALATIAAVATLVVIAATRGRVTRA